MEKSTFSKNMYAETIKYSVRIINAAVTARLLGAFHSAKK